MVHPMLFHFLHRVSAFLNGQVNLVDDNDREYGITVLGFETPRALALQRHRIYPVALFSNLLIPSHL